jgi:transcriptional regulator of heat shock response
MSDFADPETQTSSGKPSPADLQFYKDELFRVGLIKDTENQRIQARLDRLVNPVKSQWNRPREVKGLPRG